jgi:translation elongation factor P/translation initiation factor 5A
MAVGNPWINEIARINSVINQTQRNIARDQALLAANPNGPDAPTLRSQIQSGEAYLVDLRLQLQTFQAEYQAFGRDSTASAGQTTAESQRARDDGATVQTPSTAPQRLTANPPPAQELEFGTNGRVRPLVQTQSTPPAELAPFALNDDDGNPLPGSATSSSSPGAGASSDDSGEFTKNKTRSEVDNVFNEGKIVPQANVLDQYASYTYTASVYLMNPEGYKQMVQSRKKILPGSQLLFQSGGAPVAGRNTYFTNDYYIDKIDITSVITGKGTNAAHNANAIKMTVIEPNGITLIGNLDRAVQAYLGSAQQKKTNFTSAIYLLVIRFYGYDDAGNLVRGGVASPEAGGQGSAFVEKFYPITFSKINFKVASKAVEYEIEGVAVNYQIAAGSSRGTIPYNVEIGGLTVKDALTGPTVITEKRTGGFTNEELDRRAREAGVVAEGEDPIDSANANLAAKAPPNAGDAPNPKLTVRQGLMTALNQFQQELVKRNTYTVADKYSIEFVNSSIEQAKIQVKNADKNKGAMAVGGTAADKANPAKQSYDPTSRVISVTAGYQIVQFIDQVIRNSTFIGDQALVRIGESTGKQESNGAAAKNVAWYKISMQATPIAYDPKRNDYAYDIKYIIHLYKLNDLISNYFQVPTYNGVHKQYNYWFTGENTQVLNYEQTYNALYTAVLSGGPGQLGGSVVNDAIKANFQPTSGESSQGAAGRVNEIGANAADYLYNPADLAAATLQIVGDPAWLQQGEAFATPGKNGFVFSPFLADGTINFESQQIMFEILINTPGDYDMNTGLIDPNKRDTVFQATNRPGATKQSYVYRANECVSEFRQGKFTQTLKGTLLTYLPDQTFKDQQALGRNTTTGTTQNGVRSNNKATDQNDNLWSNQSGLNVLTEDVPSDETEEDVPISLNNPQPTPAPRPPTSSGDIFSNTNSISPEFGDLAGGFVAPPNASSVSANVQNSVAIQQIQAAIARNRELIAAAAPGSPVSNRLQADNRSLESILANLRRAGSVAPGVRTTPQLENRET